MSDVEWLPAAGDEHIVWQGRPRNRVVLQGLAVGVLTGAVVAAVAVELVASGTLSLVGGLAVGVPIAVLAVAVPTGAVWLWRRTTHYVLTERALYHRTGVLSVTVTELPLGKIQNTAYDLWMLGVVFGHGTVTVDTASSEGAELTLRALDDPDDVHRQISAYLKRFQGGTDDLPGTLDQWRAVLRETRRIRRLTADADSGGS
ncbi:PH domain-containing protein [Haloarcula halophila]|uniref:PH domain-containing protein n=1 Tax=Haloarcula TaxID=2237 RepID=UPI0023E3EB5A|nr:PH domain-containing protein [Halomicroarcula sp. DFY41]